MMLTTKTINAFLIPGLANRKKFDLTKHRYTIEEVAEKVTTCLFLSIDKLKEKNRKRELVIARQIVGYICTKLLSIPHTREAVGRYLDVDHATVIHGNKAIANLIDTDPEFKYKSTIIFKSLDL